MSIEAMKQALEAIANSGDFLFNWHDCEPNNEREMSRYQEVLAMNEKAFTALRTAIEQMEKKEPAEIDPLPRACHLAGVDYRIYLKIKAYMPVTPAAQRQWVGLIRGVRVDEDKVIITAKGGNDAARALCAALLEVKERHDGD